MLLPALASPPFKSKLILKSWVKAVKPSAQVLGSLCQASVGEWVDVFLSPVLFHEGNLLLFFLYPFKSPIGPSNRANIRSKGIKLGWKVVTGPLFNAGYFAILHSVPMGVMSTNMCISVFIHVFYAHGGFPLHAQVHQQNSPNVFPRSQQNNYNWVQLNLSFQIDPKNN